MAYGGSQAKGQIGAAWPTPQPQQRQIQATSATYIHHSSWQCRILNPLSKASEAISSWIQIGFLTTVPRRELPTFFTSWYPEMIYANHWNYFVRSQILSKCSNSPWHLLTKMSMCKAQRSLSSMVREHPQGLPAHWSPFPGNVLQRERTMSTCFSHPPPLTQPHLESVRHLLWVKMHLSEKRNTLRLMRSHLRQCKKDFGRKLPLVTLSI